MSSATKNIQKHPIYIVDDSQIQLILIEKILTKEGFAVRTFLNGFKLLKALEAQRPGLIISDIDMPVLDGFDLVERIRSKSGKPEIPLFLISSKIDTATRKRARKTGVNVLLQKPFKYQALIDVVEEVIGPVKV